MYKLTAIIVLVLSALATVNAGNDDKKRGQQCVFKCPDIGNDRVTSSTTFLKNHKALVCVYDPKKKDKKNKGRNSCFYDQGTGHLFDDEYRGKCRNNADKFCQKKKGGGH